KVWIKASADDQFQIPHAESGAVIYGFAASAAIEYMSDHSDNYDPANWPPQFTRVLVLYLAMLAGPKIGRIGNDDLAGWYQKVEAALGEAERVESVTAINTEIAADRDPVMLRAIEYLGQQLGGSIPAHSDMDHLRWQMNRGWN